MSARFDREKETSSLRRKGLTDEKVINDLAEHKRRNPDLLKTRIPCEMFDKVNLMCRSYMDRMARFEVDYDFEVDENAFKNVAVCCLECVPILHSRVVKSPITPYWKVCDYNINDMVFSERVDDLEKAKNDFFKREIPLSHNVQMNIGVFYHENKTHICFIWNHMCFDGGGYKSFWTDFCKNYTNYVLNGTSPIDFSSGSRKYTEVYKDFDKSKKRRSKTQFANISPRVKHAMPFKNNEKTDNIILVSEEIDSDRFSSAVKYAKSVGATVNDILLASYIDALGKISGIAENESISVSCATDLRRYIKDPSSLGYTNHVSFIHCSLDEKGCNVKETLKKVSSKTKELKQDEFMGLHGLPLLNIAYKTMIYLQAEAVVKLFYKNPTLSVSNVGAIDTKAFSLAHNPPFSALVAGAAKNKPCAVMTALSINGVLKVSMCLHGTDEDEALLKEFFGEFKKSVESL